MTEDDLVSELAKLRRWIFRPKTGESLCRRLAPKATLEQVERTEERLGFEMPRLLRRIYLEVANGGFGPGYGLSGCEGGHVDDYGHDIARSYAERRQTDPEDSGWSWPEKTVPLFSWGGAVFTCGEFDTDGCPLSEFDPHRYRGPRRMARAFRAQAPSLADFLERWLRGESVALT